MAAYLLAFCHLHSKLMMKFTQITSPAMRMVVCTSTSHLNQERQSEQSRTYQDVPRVLLDMTRSDTPRGCSDTILNHDAQESGSNTKEYACLGRQNKMGEEKNLA
jgi:hypothetical protein